jgi:hypothetical protein
MSIADEAALLLKYNDFTATATEITAWSKATPFKGDTTVTNVGLFGADLTKFNEDCVDMEDKCDVADYEDWSGWAIGVNFTPATARTADSTNAIAFEDNKQVL